MDLVAAGSGRSHRRNSACDEPGVLRNEGKIHLGFVYANDPSLRSARERMVEGAATFGLLLSVARNPDVADWGW